MKLAVHSRKSQFDLGDDCVPCPGLLGAGSQCVPQGRYRLERRSTTVMVKTSRALLKLRCWCKQILLTNNNTASNEKATW